MRSSEKALSFPLAGVSRRGSYRQQARPYTAPWAVNMRTVGPSEERRRGGSRPGLAKLCPTQLGTSVTSLVPITYIDPDGTRRYDLVYVNAAGVLGYVRAGVASTTTAELEGPDGVDILDDDDETIDFEGALASSEVHAAVRNGSVYFADTTLKKYSPGTGVAEPVVASAGSVPTGQPLIALYRDRIFLAGLTQAWYASRLGDPTDWNYGAAMEDSGAAVSGQLSLAGKIGFTVTALIPVNDQALVMASASTLWVLRGDPAGGGRLLNVSHELGIVARDAWAMTPDGLLCFLTHDGVYLWDAGSSAAPARLSAERLPDELREVDASANKVTMAYDPEGRGFHLFVTPARPSVGYHWWIDLESKAFWPQRFPEVFQPRAAATVQEEGLGYVAIGCQDGYVRYFPAGQVDDDGLPLASHLMIGPVRLGKDDSQDGLVAEIHGAMEGVSAESDGKVTWRLVTGRSAAEAAEAALEDLEAELDGEELTHVVASGEFGEGRGRVARPRARGAWVVVWLTSVEAWSYELVALVGRQLGRHR